MECNYLPGIVRIHMIRCKDLPAYVMFSAIGGAKVYLNLAHQQIKFFGTPKLTWEGSMLNGSRQEKSTFEFSTKDPIPEGEHLAFVAVAASGNMYLVGAREPNYPIISYSETVGAPDGEAALRKYKITHVAQISVVPCYLYEGGTLPVLEN